MISSSLPNTAPSNSFRLVCGFSFAIAALVLRFAPLPENFACFGALSLFCGWMLAGAWRWGIPLLTLFAGDCFGHYMGIAGFGFYYVPSMVFNYVGFASMIGIGMLMSRMLDQSLSTDFAPWGLVGFGAVTGSVAFFLISNFGAWLDPILGYGAGFAEIIRCYAMGLPFYRATLISDVMFGLGFYATYQFAAASVSNWERRAA